MSLFGAITTFAASSLTTAILESSNTTSSPPNANPAHQRDQHVSAAVQDQTNIHPSPQQPHRPMPPPGLPPNSIWSTMSYPIPRGPCLQKSSLISAGCACQRFMVHPLKASTSFDCDGCGHHASFHRMKSSEEEVENAARFRESMMQVSRNSAVNPGSGRTVGLLIEEEGDDETVSTVEGDDGVYEGRARRGAGRKATQTTMGRPEKRKRREAE